MDSTNRCPQCDAELAGNAPRGLCPACLLKGGLGTQTGESGDGESQGGDFTPPTPAELAAYFPDLEILELIGRGGMGIVYKARQKSLDRLVAVKILSPKISRNAAFADRFAREAHAMAMLSHPHVVTVYDSGRSAGVPPAKEKAGETQSRSAGVPPAGAKTGETPALQKTGETPALQSDDGLYYFLMEFIDGLNLRQLLDAGKLAPEEALAIVPQICDALQYAHNHGVVHRDIKPENILLDKEGQVKIADFGLAKLVGGERNDFSLTASGQLMGTFHYMAPEQFEHPKEVDHRTDIYSLGVVFYQMLTGELPMGRFAPPSRKVQIDVRLDEVVLRALEKEPEQRYQQASEVKTQVETITNTPLQQGGLPRTEPDLPLRSTRGHYATPEYLLTPRGGLWQWQGSGELALYKDRLLFSSDWQRTEIPLASLQELGMARVTRWLSPPGHKFLSIIYDDKGQRKTLLFMVGSLWLCSPGESKRRAEECIVAIREAAQAATGNDVPRVTSKPVVMPTSPVGVIFIVLPVLLGVVFNLWLLFGGLHTIAGVALPTPRPMPEPLAHVVKQPTPLPPPARQPIVDPPRVPTPLPLPPLPRLSSAGAGRVPGAADAGMAIGRAAAVSPAAEMLALKGKWNIVHIEKGADADNYWGAILSYGSHPGSEKLLPDLHRLLFNQWGELLFFSSQEQVVGRLAYTICPTTIPKTIDLSHLSDQKQEPPLVYGIYKIDGDRLTICLTKILPWVKTDQRPTQYKVEPGSSDIVLTLERPRDEKATTAQDALAPLNGWSPIQQVEDGKSASNEELRRTCYTVLVLLSKQLCIFGKHRIDADGTMDPTFEMMRFTLDSSKQPKQITFVEGGQEGQTTPRTILPGIYRLEGDVLLIAYRKGVNPPEQFASTPGSGVTLLQLRRTPQPAPIRVGRPSRPAPQTASAQPTTAADESAKTPPVILRVADKPNGPWIGRLPNGVTVELLTIGENGRWWQPNGAPAAGPPCPLSERGPRSPEPDFTRRAFFARIGGVPLGQSAMNFEVRPSSGSDDRIAYQDIQKVPTHSYFSGVETGVPNTAKTVAVRWGVSAGPWQDAALAVLEPEGGLIGPGSWGDRLNSLRVAKTGMRGTEQLEMPYQRQYEERAIAILRSNNGFMKADFTRSQDRVVAMFESSHLAHDFREIKLQRRPYAWVEFQGVPTQWSDTPIRSPSLLPNTCNVAAQAKGPWVARLPSGVSVELVGVNDEDRWWQPDGSPLAEPPCQFDSRGVCDDASLVRRRFFLRLNGLPSQPAGIVGNVAPGVAPVTPTTVPQHVRQAGKQVENRVTFLAFEAFVPPASRTITAVTCGIATGPWKDFTSPSVLHDPQSGYISGGVSGGGYNVSLHISKNKDGVTAGVSVDRLETDDFRLVLITYDGRALTGPARIDHPKKQQTQTTVTATYPGLTLQEIKTVNIERRPYEWVCFPYVAAKPETEASPEAIRSNTATPPEKR
jgi:uncharacterized protein (TIGR03067 family)